MAGDPVEDAYARVLERRQAQQQTGSVVEGGTDPGTGGAQPAGPSVLDMAWTKVRAARQGVNVQNAYDATTTAEFQRSLDGDTADFSRGKLRTPTRFAGIDAPESGQGQLGKDAQAYLDQLIKDNGGKVRFGMKKKDIHGRDVGVMYAGDKNLNVELVRAGHAQVYRSYLRDLSPEMIGQLQNAEQEAKEAQRGIWAPGSGFEDPETWRRAQPPGSMAQGHDMRPPLDPETQTVAQAWRAVRARRGDPIGEAALNVAGRREAGAMREQIASDERFQKESGWLDRFLNGLDYAGNVSRSAIVGGERGGLATAWQYAKQAAVKERETSPTQTRDAVFGKRRFGKDDYAFDIGDLGDFAADLATGVVTDPLTWLSAGVSGLAKGGRIAALAPELARGAVESKLGMATADAAKYAKFKATTGAAVGAAYGLGAVDHNDEDGIGQELLAASVGAAAGAFAPKAVEKSGALFRQGFTKASDWYATTTRGSRFADFSQARELAVGAYDKMKDISEWIRQGRYQALEGLADPVDRLRAAEVMEDLKTEFLRRRGRIEELQKQGKARGFFGRTNDAQLANIRDKLVTADIEKTYLPQILQQEKAEVADAVVKWGQHNDAVVKKLNEMRYGIEDGKPTKSGKGIFGIRWHIDDVAEKEAGKTAESAFNGFQIQKAKSLKRSDAFAGIAQREFEAQTGRAWNPATATKADEDLLLKLGAAARDKTYGVYAEGFAKRFLDDAETKAMGLVKEYAQTPAAQKPLQYVERTLKGYDKLSNFIKANMLYFSTTWIKNNFFDNLAKSYVEGGLHSMMDAATFGHFREGVSKDVKDLYANRLNRVYKSADMQDALKRGVLDNPMFKSLEDKATRAFLYTPEQLQEQLAKMNPLERFAATITNNPYSQMIGSIGSHMEGTARMVTYMHVKDALLSSARFKNASAKEIALAKDIAAQVVKKTFFDYGDVTHFEKAVFGRLVPFYSFYSKNLPYWTQAVLDPARAGRVASFERIFSSIGHPATSFDKEGMTPYLAENAPRKLGTDEYGNKRYAIRPSSSLADAIKMLDVRPSSLVDQALDKGAPILKTAGELATGKDSFDGGPLFPSAIAKEDAAQRGLGDEGKVGKKFLFSRGFKHAAIKQAIETTLGEGSFSKLVQKAAGVEGVQVDKGGNPLTTSDSDVAIDKIMSTFWPKGVVDQIAGSVGKVYVGKEDVVQALVNRMAPITEVKVSPAYERMVRSRKAKAKGE